MNVRTVDRGPIPAVKQWLCGLWEFYRHYTHTAIHAASAAALTIFGLLVFIDPLFVGVAIAAYVCPPLVLYVLSGVAKTGSARSASANAQTTAEPTPVVGSGTGPESDRIDPGPGSHDNGDSDSDGDDGDSDSDSDDEDTDTDS